MTISKDNVLRLAHSRILSKRTKFEQFDDANDKYGKSVFANKETIHHESNTNLTTVINPSEAIKQGLNTIKKNDKFLTQTL